ncbi:MAG: cytochrome b/b6 domain-containing protein, partial [Candidatus Omnitrophota bacterium]
NTKGLALNRIRRLVLLVGCLSLALLMIGISSPGAAADDSENAGCVACHDSVDTTKYTGSVHGNNLCSSCHKGFKDYPHPEKPASVNCGNCHRFEAEVYANSDHGKAVKSGIQAAACLNCHGKPHELKSARNPDSPVYRLNVPKTCAVCHEDQQKMDQYNLLEKTPFKSYLSTVHGIALSQKGQVNSAICTDCHGSHDLHAPTNPKSKIYRLNVPATCGKCHENVLQGYKRSVHGKAALSGKIESPVCTDCHGEHTIKSHLDPASRVYTTTVSEKVCGACHSAEKVISKYRLPGDRLKTYLASYHGLASKQGITTVANCASCHGAHDILPSSDTESSVNKKNLPQTCGKCHPNVGNQLAKGSVHLAPSFTRDRIIYWVSLFYILLIIGVIGGMIVHNLLDLRLKLVEHFRRKKIESTEPRFNRSERIQHWILTSSFVVLAYSGFALKYSEAWWAQPFTLIDLGFDWRGFVHRLAALVFCLLCAYHGFYVFFTRRGRMQLRALLPVWKDFTDVWDIIKLYLGFSHKKPPMKRYHYVEKAEYWALIWGSLIMIGTGALLTFENIAMRVFPKWVIDVATTIHFYEALLATLAIVVWHLYFTIFDPEKYPMNWSMITGKTDEKRDNTDEPVKTPPAPKKPADPKS